ncbi:hypothetical protein Celaphus_00003447 [Cervus elaphus hippelaphus]|uniref:Uncharacterized protein n=1 Tax=Cervus elaphus hippelaphus TaxID=46360 RepID=A0A212D221_CEREH|nr:hypothetical protein Celaphus_00003447 [Cervus elaphus hippelaphus]
MTHLGISGGLGLGPGYDVPGLHSPLSHPSLQSSLNNPNLQASLSGPQPQLQGSHSHPSRLPSSSLAHHALPATSLVPGPAPPPLCFISGSALPTSLPPPPPPYSASAPGSFLRHDHVPLSPHSLQAQPMPEGPNSNCPNSFHQQCHPPCLPSLRASPWIPVSCPPTSGCLHIHYSPLPQFGSAHPATHPKASAAARAALSGLSVWPSGCQPLGRQLQCGTLYPPSPSEHGQPSYHRSMSDFGLGNLEQFSMGNPSTSCVLSDPCALLPDPAVEDLFHSDWLEASPWIPVSCPPTSGCLHIHYSPLPQFGSAHPATHPKASAAARAALSGLSVWPSGCQPLGRQLQCGTLYPPSPSEHGQPSYHRSMSDFGLGNLEQFSMGNPSTSWCRIPLAFPKGLDP